MKLRIRINLSHLAQRLLSQRLRLFVYSLLLLHPPQLRFPNFPRRAAEPDFVIVPQVGGLHSGENKLIVHNLIDLVLRDQNQLHGGRKFSSMWFWRWSINVRGLNPIANYHLNAHVMFFLASSAKVRMCECFQGSCSRGSQVTEIPYTGRCESSFRRTCPRAKKILRLAQHW